LFISRLHPQITAFDKSILFSIPSSPIPTELDSSQSPKTFFQCEQILNSPTFLVIISLPPQERLKDFGEIKTSVRNQSLSSEFISWFDLSSIPFCY
jgi:hypothetical protein